MSMRFFRRVKIFPGVTLNLSKPGTSVSLGIRGLHYTFGGKRGSRVTAGLPGTGLSYTEKLDDGKDKE